MTIKTAARISTALATAIFGAGTSLAQRTITVTAFDAATRQVSLAFDGRASGTEKLYVAYGPADGGEYLEGWANSALLDGSLAASATSGTYALPAAADGCAMRFFTGDDETVPYDAEISYLQSTGDQYIDTGLMGRYDDVWFGSLRFVDVNPGNCFPVAAWPGKSGEKRYTPLQFNGTKFVTVVNGAHSAEVAPPEGVNNTTTYKFKSKIASGSQTVRVNGREVERNGITAALQTTANTYIFARNISTTASGTNLDGWCKIQLDYLQLWYKGELIRDWIPVRVGTTGYLYDRVNGVLYGDQKGTTPFTLGPDTRAGGTRFAPTGVSAQFRPDGLLVTAIDWENRSATLSFPALGEAATLWAVYATDADAGAYNPNGWDVYEKIADLVAGSTGGTYTFTSPAGAGAAYAAMRFVIAGKDDDATLFDYALDYLEATGAQYIDTGVVGAWGDRWTSRFRLMDTTSDCFIAGSVGGTKVGNTRYAVCQWFNGHFSLCVNAAGTYDVQVVPDTVQTDFDYYVDAISYSNALKNTVNGETNTSVGGGAVANKTVPVYLFGRSFSNGSVDNKANAKIYDFKMDRYCVPVLDLVPVVKDGRGCFYNKVDGSFLYVASGSSEFDAAKLAAARGARRHCFTPSLTSEACAAEAASVYPLVTCDSLAVDAVAGEGTIGWTLTSAGATSSSADIYAVVTAQDGRAVTNLIASAVAAGDSGSSAVAGLFAPGQSAVSLFARNGAGAGAATFPSAFTNEGVASAPDSSALLIAAETGRISVSCALSAFGSGTTYAWLEYGATSALGNTVQLPTLVNDGTSATQEYACTFDPPAAVLEAGAVYAKVVCSNEVTGAFGTYSWQNATSVKSAKVSFTYTWIGGAAGEWCDGANWTVGGLSGLGWPRTDGVTARFPENTAATVTLSRDVTVKALDFSASGLDLTFASDSSTPRALAFARVSWTAGSANRYTFDKVALASPGSNSADDFALAMGSTFTLAEGASFSWAGGNEHPFRLSTTTDDTPYYTGTVDVQPGATLASSKGPICVGGNGVLRIGGTVSATDVTYGFWSMGGGTIQFYGDSPRLAVNHTFRAKVKGSAVRNIDAKMEFLMPAGGWSSRDTPIVSDSYVANDFYLGGKDGERDGLDMKLKISVPDESPAFAANRPRRALRGDYLLVAWPEGINTDGVVLDNSGTKGQTLFYTWSDDPTATTGEGLPKYIWVNYNPPRGTMIIVR